MDRSMESLDALFRGKMDAVLRELQLVGVVPRVIGTLRSVEEQNRLYAQGRTSPGPIVTHCRGGHSYHNFGLACDLDYVPPYSEWNASLRDSVIRIAANAGLTWGGTWKFLDEAHWEDRSRGLLGRSHERRGSQ